MSLKALLEEYNLEIDDVRWYLSCSLAERLLQYRERSYELIKYIWSGVLEDELYEMEERYLAQLQADYDRGYIDDAKIREILAEMVAARTRRYSEPLG